MLEYRTVRKAHFSDDEKALVPWAENDPWGDLEYTNFMFLYDDDKVIRFINSDGGEPEDQTMDRNWHWVERELNWAINRQDHADRF